ncbi:BRCA1-associated RING domain protein 1 [Morus notabilis]|uniref:BRCA1-associated RING domain protein 1 n=1 Tax=Morus notabilis TaxID=981085 RepID=UPI000CED4B7D|nr:BRCA1-associated RING domain protein 1 [Morus notabilis]
MADSVNCDSRRSSRLLNPWVLNFQKLGLEFKCPLCLSLLNRPTLLPCNHVFCKSCLPGSTQFGVDCPVCKTHCVGRDLRHLPFMENMVTIYRCLDATFSAKLFQPAHSDAERVSMQSPASTNIRFGDQMNEELPENGQGDNSGSGQSVDKQIGVDKSGKVENFIRECKRNDKGLKHSGEECTTVEIYMNPVSQSLPDSPPSFGDARGSDNDGYYRCSEHSSENSLAKRPSQDNDGSKIGKLRTDSAGFGKDGNLREVKRQKQLNYGVLQLSGSSAVHFQDVSKFGALMTNSESKLQMISQPSVQAPKILDGQLVNKTTCAFCHSSDISENTGTMLHYSSGKLVLGDEATLPNVIHVHKVCIDWAPQVYYVDDDRVENLKEELARGAKLRCSTCGHKGAALGCYVRSCRKSYHVPCAMGISKCRWDYEDFLILCPAHSSVRFPSEKPKSRKIIAKDHTLPAIASCQLSNFVPSLDGEKKMVFCGSALSTDEKALLVKYGKMSGATVSKFWNPNVTHVIAATDDKDACTRTLKFLMAILNGRWIVKVDWLRACMEANCHVNEEPYEVCLDNHGCCDGPKNGRLRASDNAPKLFSGLNFYLVGDFLPSYKEDLQDLVTAAGGTVLRSREELVARSSKEAAPTPRALVVYNIDPLEGCRLGEEVAILFQRLSEAEDAASQTGSKVIGHTWLLESIAGYKLLPIVT